MSPPPHAWMTWTIAALATFGVIVRPFQWPEAVWAVAGAVLLVALRMLTPHEAWTGVSRGGDVYLFLVGMMLLAEIAREVGLFDWLAAVATQRARGSAARLFLLVYLVGTVVTTFLSNDATAVVLTPAVAAAAKTAKVEKRMPYLLICAFIANAASFVLPISNPANLVIYGAHVPPLLEWLPRYVAPSVASIAVTYVALRFTQRRALTGTIATDVAVPPLAPAGVLAGVGIAATAAVLLTASALNADLGLPTAIAGATTAAIVLVKQRASPGKVMASVSWGVLPLVAGLFVLVEGLEKTGFVGSMRALLQKATAESATGAAWGAGVVIALASNLTNNLPAGLIAGSTVQAAQTSPHVTSAILIGVDLGPNLSVTGSLATILWLTALRREGETMGAWAFFRIGLVVMPVALVLALAASLMT